PALQALADVVLLIQSRLFFPEHGQANEAIGPPALNQEFTTGFGGRESLMKLPHVLGEALINSRLG
ncbi:MAG TPA: hypothetical protein VF078_11555, partial [Nitrospira sp.]